MCTNAGEDKIIPKDAAFFLVPCISLDLALCHIFYQYCQNSLRLIRHIMKKKNTKERLIIQMKNIASLAYSFLYVEIFFTSEK